VRAVFAPVVVDYTVNGDSFVPGKPRLGPKSDFLSRYFKLVPGPGRQALRGADSRGMQEHEIAMLLNLFDELRRKVPVAK
jgi:hypothetical protein